MSTHSPLIAIVGATGTGKSQLAVALAERFNGEIVNADALQLYAGLPIVTNKLPEEERKGIPHHLLGCIRLEEEPWTVAQFVKKSVEIVEKIRARGQVPIVVGGTHYYVQSLMFKDSILGEHGLQLRGKETGYLTSEEQEQKWPILAGTGAEMLAELQKVDPDMALRWHPSDTRKIRRSLEIWLNTGKKASEVYEEQRVSKQPSKQDYAITAGKMSCKVIPEDLTPSHPILRYNTLTLWIHADPSVLKPRLNARVNTMIASGLVSEVQSMRALHVHLQATPSENTDLTKGIWVAIGYKEFAAYRSALEQGEADEKRLAALKRDAVDATQAATRQYARRQVRWIRLKLLRELRGGGGGGEYKNLYVLDGTDVERFTESVEGVATRATEAFLSGKEMPDPMSTSETAGQVLRQNLVDLKGEGGLEDARRMERECGICDIVLVTPNDWKQHLRSKGHNYRLKQVKKELENEKEESHGVGGSD